MQEQTELSNQKTLLETLIQVAKQSGEVGSIILEKDWAKTDLGPIHAWSSTLLSTLAMILSSKFPLVLYWGPNLRLIYNEAYIPIIAARHPKYFGEPSQKVWSEVWTFIGPMLSEALQGKSSWYEDAAVFVTRYGFLEEAYFTWSCSPVYDEHGQIPGVIIPIFETTKRVFQERRMKSIREMGSLVVTTHTNVTQSCKNLGSILSSNTYDIPFSLLYIINSQRTKLEIKSATGYPINNLPSCIPLDISLSTNLNSSPNSYQSSSLETLLRRFFFGQQSKEVMSNPKDYLDETMPLSVWGDELNKVVIAKIFTATQDGPTGIVVVGLNPRCFFDEDYDTFIDLMVGKIGKIIASAKLLEQEQKRAEELAKIDKAKTTFFSNVSHEFRTPLALILGPLMDSLADKEHPLDRVQRERQEIIYRNASRILKLVNSILDFSSLEAGRMQIKFVKTNISRLTRSIASLFEPIVSKAKLKYEIQIESIESAVYVDQTMWEQIVMNLISNAFKYTLHGKIAVILKQEANYLILKVSDTGIGIPESAMEHIFERFYRVSDSKGRSFEGTGIGLALILELIKLHKGTIQLESKQDVGSTFTVSIPVGDAHLDPSQIFPENYETTSFIKKDNQFIEEASQWLEDCSPISSVDSFVTSFSPLNSQPSTPATTSTILLADDNYDMRIYIKGILEKYWKVIAVNDGEEAYYMALQKPPDLILSDVMMPKMDGFELIKKLKSNIKTAMIPIILLSARAGEEAKVEGLHMGADDYLVKTSFSAKELVAKINIHLELYKLRVKLESEVDQRNKQLLQTNAELQEQIKQTNKAATALEESELRYRNLTDLAPVGICHLDKQGRYIYTNQALQHHYEQSHEELCLHTWLDSIDPRDKEQVMAQWNDFKEGQTSKLQCVYRITITQQVNKVKWIYIQIIPHQGTDTTSSWFYIATQTDITEQKILEEQNIKILSQAEEQQRLRAQEEATHRKMKEQFVDTVCHEIRNPLNGIQGSLEQLYDLLEQLLQNLKQNDAKLLLEWIKGKYEEIRQCIDCIQECASHQNIITNDVLNLSKIESGRVELSENACHVNKLIKSVVLMFSSEIHSKQLSIEYDLGYDKEEEDLLVLDEYKLKLILINLLLNSIKFTPANGTIRILKQWHVSHSILEISINDNGIGMDESEQEKLFQNFKQGGFTIGKKYGGSGLGLAIVYELVKLMKGSISVKSKKSQGSTFTIRLRSKAAHFQHRKSSPAVLEFSAKLKSLIKSTSTDKIEKTTKPMLVVEDNEINQKVLCKFLKNKGYEYEVAWNGKEAVSLFEVGKYSFIFMDIVMPEMDGFEATKHIRAIEASSSSTESVPIICVSGNARQEHIEEAERVGMNDYVSKPIKSEQIYDIIGKWSNN